MDTDSSPDCLRSAPPVSPVWLASPIVTAWPLDARPWQWRLLGAAIAMFSLLPQLPLRAQVLPPNTLTQRLQACTACHGKDGRAASDGFYPRIAGKPAGYLYNQLINFREGRRQYPLMIYLVDHLPDSYLQEIAAYFSQQHPPYAPLQPVSVAPAVLARGEQLAQRGDRAKNVPACVACHGQSLTGVAPSIPGLLGLPRDYVSAQFGAWKNGARRAAAPDCMAQIAQRLDVADINAAAAWLASQPIPADPLPAAPSAGKLPLECGSAAQSSQSPAQQRAK